MRDGQHGAGRFGRWFFVAAVSGTSGVVACDEATVVDCGSGQYVVEQGVDYCVYDAATVAELGGSVACPDGARVSRSLGQAVVCAATDVEPSELPAGGWRLAGLGCYLGDPTAVPGTQCIDGGNWAFESGTLDGWCVDLGPGTPEAAVDVSPGVMELDLSDLGQRVSWWRDTHLGSAGPPAAVNWTGMHDGRFVGLSVRLMLFADDGELIYERRQVTGDGVGCEDMPRLSCDGRGGAWSEFGGSFAWQNLASDPDLDGSRVSLVRFRIDAVAAGESLSVSFRGAELMR